MQNLRVEVEVAASWSIRVHGLPSICIPAGHLEEQMRFITKQSDCKLNKNTNCAHHPGNLHSKYYDRRDFGSPLLQYNSVADPGFLRRAGPTTEGCEPASYLENVLPRTVSPMVLNIL